MSVVDLDAHRKERGGGEGPKLCGAKTRRGRPCKRPAGAGTNHPGIGRCKLHGGSTRNHVIAAAKIAAEREAQRMVARAGVDADPIEHLLESLHRAAALVEVWGAMVAAIDEAAEEEAKSAGEIRGALGYDHADPDSHDELVVWSRDRMMALNRHGEAQVHPYVREYQAALERRAKFAKLCIDAGIAEKHVQLLERQVELAQKAFEATLGELDLSAADKQKVRRGYARHLRAVA